MSIPPHRSGSPQATTDVSWRDYPANVIAGPHNAAAAGKNLSDRLSRLGDTLFSASSSEVDLRIVDVCGGDNDGKSTTWWNGIELEGLVGGI